MNESVKMTDDSALEWLYASARDYPLLSADEERSIDGRKWEARTNLVNLFLGDERCRLFFAAWVDNLLHNPPTLETFTEREHYYLLRREQGDLRKSVDKKALLTALSDVLQSVEDWAGAPQKVSAEAKRVLEELDLSAVLIAGMANLLINENSKQDMARALRYWRGFWPDAASTDTPTAETHLAAMRRELAHYNGAREQLVQHNLRLVFSVAGKLQSQSVPFQDRVQSGVMGLIRAAEKYDSRKGFRFSTYAYSWINQAARRMLEEQRGIVRYPADVNEQLTRMARERANHISKTGRTPRMTELAEQMEVKPEALAKLQQVSNWSVSLDSTPDGEDGLTLAETLPGVAYSAPSAHAEKDSLNRCLQRSLRILTPQEQRVVTLRWGLEDSQPLTRKEMADHLQVSSERIRQLELSALEKLRDDREVIEAFQDYAGAD